MSAFEVLYSSCLAISASPTYASISNLDDELSSQVTLRFLGLFCFDRFFLFPFPVPILFLTPRDVFLTLLGFLSPAIELIHLRSKSPLFPTSHAEKAPNLGTRRIQERAFSDTSSFPSIAAFSRNAPNPRTRIFAHLLFSFDCCIFQERAESTLHLLRIIMDKSWMVLPRQTEKYRNGEKEKGHPPSRVELFQACFTHANGSPSSIIVAERLIGCSVLIKSLFDSTKIVAKGVLHSMDPNTIVGR
ncbi:uncharacterized protein LOC121978619 [Zingiber officinale]|uniref:uncharacterized protein LOC121978619 n=1 Tax=Zingiber officinale TaxID=94328 RepID=UPI001C4A80B5|nr:uncharacterized protein LOC121978619 [Zingiber officinale]